MFRAFLNGRSTSYLKEKRMSLKVSVEAPSNIALIKYMGKSNHQVNAPANPSLSYTLKDLKTKVSIEETENINVIWKSEENSSYSISLNDAGKNKFLIHWDRCHQRMASNFQKGVIITSGNNFPSDCGLASSASSFAALTLAAHQFFLELGLLERIWTQEDLALLSREGSGSSCRSFFEPWALWSGDKVQPLENTEWSELLHMAIVVDHVIDKYSGR
jgi:diphosphomevalonate decarboxylase